MSRQKVLREMYTANKSLGDPGASGTITPVHYGQVCNVVTATAEARTLAQPTQAGMLFGIVLKTDGGDLTLTVTGGYNADGATSITFADAGDFVAFMSVAVSTSFVWKVVGHEGTDVAVEDINVDQLTFATLTSPAVATSHGAGAIGTALAPATSRRTENGTIITEIKIDLTGLASKNTADDIIGLSAGGAAYIGRNVVASNGIIYRVEMACIETPAGGDDDINLVAGSAADDAYDGAVTGAAVLLNCGNHTAGMQVVSDIPHITANYYLYLTAGTGDLAAAYTAGMFVIRLYGHALLA